MKRIKRLIKRGKAPAEAPQRITNETVAEHREKVLAGGRKFKYPVQYSRHKLIINSVLIALAVVVLTMFLSWQQLYVAQNTSKFIYRATQLVPLPVARVDGRFVKYSDYLMKFRSSLHFLQRQNAINARSEDGRRQIEFIKRRELDSVLKDAYVAKLAKQQKLTVSGKEVTDFITTELKSRNVSLVAYEKTVLNNYYDWSLDEYKAVVHKELLKRKVSFAIDTAARARIIALKQQLDDGADLAALARDQSDDLTTKGVGGDSGLIALDDQDPNGLIAAASKLEVGKLSGIIEGGDGYYVVKLTAKTDTNIQYSLIKVSLTTLDAQFSQLKSQHKIHEYITVKST